MTRGLYDPRGDHPATPRGGYFAGTVLARGATPRNPPRWYFTGTPAARPGPRPGLPAG